jgi:curli production assembly/transport component CsgF
MAKVSNSIIAGTTLLLSLNGVAAAGQLVYRPVNPSFGGDPFNSAHLLGIANANDRYKDPNEVDIEEVLNDVDFGTTGTTTGTTPAGTTATGNGLLTDGIGNGTSSTTGTDTSTSTGISGSGSAARSGLGLSVTPNADGSFTIR